MNDAQPFAVRVGNVFAGDSVQARMNPDSTELIVEARIRELTAPPARYGPETGREFEQWLAEVRRALYTRVIVQRQDATP